MREHDVHADSLETSSAITGYCVADAIPPLKVIAVLNEAKVNFLLIGTHAIGGWMKKPRACQNIDLITAARQHARAVHALLAAFGRLEMEKHESGAYFEDRQSKGTIIAVLRPNRPLYRAALKHTRLVNCRDQAYKIPSLEMALAMKYASIHELPGADPDRYQDMHDFMYMAKVNHPIDREKLTELGELVYPGGGQDLAELVHQVQAGEKVTLWNRRLPCSSGE